MCKENFVAVEFYCTANGSNREDCVYFESDETLHPCKWYDHGKCTSALAQANRMGITLGKLKRTIIK